jgi:predicted glycosyltransferase
MVLVVYAQHLSGVGHYVRGFEIAKALARHHDVWFVEGGRPVPRLAAPGLRSIVLPPIERTMNGMLVSSKDGSADLNLILAERSARLCSALESLRADVLLVEHYPFSKWELEGEILAAVRAARRANPALRVFSSLRDVCRKTRHDGEGVEDYRAQVLRLLEEHFDGLFIHCDPRFSRLEEHFDGAGEIPVPVEYTGFVAEEPPDRISGVDRGDRQAQELEQASRRGFAVLSAGGGARAFPMVRAVVEAWRLLAGASGETGGRQLRLFTGLYWSEAQRRELEQAVEDLPVFVHAFSPDFQSWMCASELSISRAGYNTCAGILRCRARALLIPDEHMSDQPFRAERLAALGLAEVATLEPPDPGALRESIQRALARQRPVHELSLDGAERTRRLIEDLAG